MQAAEDRSRHDGCGATGNIVGAWTWHALGDSLVPPSGVEMRNVLVEHRTQVGFAKDDDVVETLPADTPKKTFTGCIHQRCVNCSLE